MNGNSVSFTVLCEGWVEKQETPSNAEVKLSNKWKTRYSLLTQSDPQQLEIRFYVKKPKVYSDITDGSIALSPWKHSVAMNCDEKERPHVIRISTYSDAISCKRSSVTVKLSMPFKEECLAWMKCIQRFTHLSPGMQGHTFFVVVNSNPHSEHIAVCDQQCVLHASKETLVLARKTTLSVVGFWPLSCIRNYSTTGPVSFFFEGGRSSPLGEGSYSFHTSIGDADKLFDLFDYLTGAESGSHVDPHPSTQGAPRPPGRGKVIKRAVSSGHPSINKPRDLNRGALNPRGRIASEPPPKPPRKPPLPTRLSETLDTTQEAPPSSGPQHKSDESLVGAPGQHDRCLDELDGLMGALGGASATLEGKQTDSDDVKTMKMPLNPPETTPSSGKPTDMSPYAEVQKPRNTQ